MFRISITSKFVGVVTILLVLVAVIFATFFPRQLRIAAEKSIEEKGWSVARMLAHRSAAPLVFGDAESVSDGLSSLSEIDHIGYAVVYSLEGDTVAIYKKVMGDGLNAEAGVSLSKENLRKDAHLPMWHLNTPILSSGEQVGSLILGIDLNDLHQQINQSRLSALIIAFSLMVIGSLAFYFMARRIVGPIRTLEEASTRVAKGDIDVQVQIRTGDETERLANSFNKMVANLQTLIKREYDNANAIEIMARKDIEKIQRELDIARQKWKEGSYLLLGSLQKLAAGDTHYLLPERSDELGKIFAQYNEIVKKINTTYEELGIFKGSQQKTYLSGPTLNPYEEMDKQEWTDGLDLSEEKKLIDYNDPFILSLIQGRSQDANG